MLSTLARRGICPNFVVTRGVFTCPFEPPVSLWGSAKNKNHHVHEKTPRGGRRRPKEPGAKDKGRFQYIRMELCTEGDAEEYMKEQPKELLSVQMSRILLFQISFALHAAASKYCLKHYDLKLLNIFLQDAANVPGANVSATGDVVLRYGLGSKNFALRMPAEAALIAKVADYGTADVKSESNGQPVSIAQFTTIENTPPDFLILGDAAKQGHAHDLFGLGLCMLHLFTGKAPYEELLDEVKCPAFFKDLLSKLWEDDKSIGYSVVRSVVMSEVFKDEKGNVVDGEPDETLYDTLYRYLVLFGIPEHKFQQRKHGKVWRAISESLVAGATMLGLQGKKQFEKDQKKYSLRKGDNTYIKRARNSLESTKGAMALLTSLVHFDPDVRATALDVLNSDFFAPLTELSNTSYESCDDVRSFTAFATF